MARPTVSVTQELGLALHLGSASRLPSKWTSVTERPVHHSIPLDELGVAWLAAQSHLKPRSYSVIEIAWRVHVRPTSGSPVLERDSPQRVAGVGQRAVGPKERNGRHSGVWSAGRDCRRRSQGPSPTPQPSTWDQSPEEVGKERHYLSHAQVQLLADESRANGTLVLFLTYTGLRWGEAVGLRIRSVDMVRRRVLVQANAVNVRGRIIPGTPKSHEARSVPLPAFLAPPLMSLCAGKHNSSLVFGGGELFSATPTQGDGWFAGARKRVSDAGPAFPPAVTLHDRRDTAASLAISVGANVKAVQRMLGHASAAMTLDTYADFFDDNLAARRRRGSQHRSLSAWLGMDREFPP